MVTPLQKHHGQHGPVIAFLLLVAATAVVWTTQPRKPAPAAVEPAKPAPAVAPLASTPAEPIETAPPVAVPARDLVARGEVSFDERRTAHVRTPVYGWLHKARQSSAGRKIRAGETLAVVYSPEVYLTTATDVAELRTFSSQENLDAVRVQLLRWGMRREMLAEIEKAMRPQATLPIIARVSGTVVAEKGAAEELVDPTDGVEMFTITDPSYASLYVDVPAAVAARASLGMRGRVTISGMTQPVTAPIGYISRHEEDGKRTVRFDLHAAGVTFAPGAQADVRVALDSK